MTGASCDAATAAVCLAASVAGPLALLCALAPVEAAAALWRARGAVLRRAPASVALPLARALRAAAEALSP